MAPHIYSCNYFRTFKLWLLFERPQDMVNTAKIIEGALFEMFYLTLSNLIEVSKSQGRYTKWSSCACNRQGNGWGLKIV